MEINSSVSTYSLAALVDELNYKWPIKRIREPMGYNSSDNLKMMSPKKRQLKGILKRTVSYEERRKSAFGVRSDSRISIKKSTLEKAVKFSDLVKIGAAVDEYDRKPFVSVPTSLTHAEQADLRSVLRPDMEDRELTRLVIRFSNKSAIGTMEK